MIVTTAHERCLLHAPEGLQEPARFVVCNSSPNECITFTHQACLVLIADRMHRIHALGLGGFSLKRMKDKSLKAVSDRFKKNKVKDSCLQIECRMTVGCGSDS